ncbi:hypothetical protein EQV77_06500 [Halobacillus fulvus]|nr:hypothetical protein EQV77_06500 [Halobacillus fulvus]
MVYHAKTPQKLLLFYLFLVAFLAITSGFSGWALVICLMFLTFIVSGIFTTFKVTIKNNKLTYQIFVFKRKIYSKTVLPENIQSIHFKRAGWVTKAAIIHVKKGANLRVIGFTPERVYGDLQSFAEQYEVAVRKSKDYLILDRSRIDY